MKIDTKFSPGDKVYFIYENKVIEDIILYLEIIARSEVSKIKYAMTNTWNKLKCPTFQENEIFATKQELLNSL